jgi:hypothetical protein
MNIVYVVHRPLVRRGDEWCEKFPNLEALASEFGEVEYLLTEPHVADRGPLIRTMQKKLKDFTEDDYLLPVGSPVAIMAATMVAARMTHGFVRVLDYDKRAQRYFETELDDV